VQSTSPGRRWLSLFVVLVGCKAPTSTETAAPTAPPAPVFVEEQTVEPEPTPEPEPVGLAAFESFLGLRYGDTVTQLHERHGPPPYSESGDEFDTLYYVMTEDTIPGDGPPGAGDDFLFVVTINRADGRIFNIEAKAGDYATAGIDDPLLRYLGAPLDEIKASFGDPIDVSSGFHSYEHIDEARNLEIEIAFVCYEFEDFLCTELWVYWYDP
jgi:hypothetical protein